MPEPETITLSDAWRNAFEESPVAMSVESGRVLPLYPLFFRGVSEPCAQYDGHYVRQTVKPAVAGGMEDVEEAYIYYLGFWEKFQDESAEKEFPFLPVILMSFIDQTRLDAAEPLLLRIFENTHPESS